MNELIKVDFDTQTVSTRDLHEGLEINTRFNDWFPRMAEYGFSEGKDFYSKMSKTSDKGGRPSVDYEITVDMAKQICMIRRTDKDFNPHSREGSDMDAKREIISLQRTEKEWDSSYYRANRKRSAPAV